MDSPAGPLYRVTGTMPYAARCFSRSQPWVQDTDSRAKGGGGGRGTKGWDAGLGLSNGGLTGDRGQGFGGGAKHAH